MSDYDNALELDPNNFLAHYNRGLMRVQLGDDNRAITDFDFIIKMEAQNFMAIFNRALLHDKTGNVESSHQGLYYWLSTSFLTSWTGLSRRCQLLRRLGMTAKAEMDEFRIFKAQINKHISESSRDGAQRPRRRRCVSVRRIDPNKFASLVSR